MSAPTVLSFYDIGCRFSYWARERERRLVRETGITLRHVPFEAFPETAPEGDKRPPYLFQRAIARLRAGDWSVPTRRLNHNTGRALRGALVAEREGKLSAYLDAAYDAYWVEGQNLGRDDVLRAIAARAGLDPEAFLQRLDDADTEAAFAEARALAARHGIEQACAYVTPDGAQVSGLLRYESWRDQLAKGAAASAR